METPKEWRQLVDAGIITEEIYSLVLFSINKRAKNCRDKQNEYWRGKYWENYYYSHDFIGIYKAMKNDYYLMKEVFLSILLPCEVHRVYHRKSNKVEYFLFYQTAYSSFHLPVDYKDIPNIKFTTRYPRYRTYYDKKPKPKTPQGPYIRTLTNFRTHGEDIKNLISAQFAHRVYELLLSGNYTYLPANRAA